MVCGGYTAKQGKHNMYVIVGTLFGAIVGAVLDKHLSEGGGKVSPTKQAAEKPAAQIQDKPVERPPVQTVDDDAGEVVETVDNSKPAPNANKKD